MQNVPPYFSKDSLMASVAHLGEVEEVYKDPVRGVILPGKTVLASAVITFKHDIAGKNIINQQVQLQDGSIVRLLKAKPGPKSGNKTAREPSLRNDPGNYRINYGRSLLQAGTLVQINIGGAKAIMDVYMKLLSELFEQQIMNAAYYNHRLKKAALLNGNGQGPPPKFEDNGGYPGFNE